ncbi:MAG: bacteriocin biosynthesis cyclodehydratase domain-containing protein [Minisyncoccia bacterium]|jgi:bacteriocin biosynthesis cyclodehydratase domain-containing protein
MISQPRFKNHLDVSVVDDDKVFIGDESSHFLMEGRALNEVARTIDGELETDELLASAAATIDIPSVMAAINRFVAGGHVADGPGLDDPAATSWWDARGLDPHGAHQRVTTAVVTVIDLTDDGVAALVSNLRDAGPEVHEITMTSLSEHPTGPTIVVVTDHLDPRLEHIDEVMRAAQTPWMVVRPSGQQLLIGPIFLPGATACWNCMTMRVSGNRQLDAYLERKRETTIARPATKPAIGATRSIAAGAAVSEFVAFLAGAQVTSLGAIVSIDAVTFASETHHVTHRPQCQACGDPSLAATPSKIVLESALKRFTADGGHRVERPEETYERLIKHVSPLTGAVSSLNRQTINDDGVTYSYASGHNFALMQDSTYFLRKNLRGRSGGKGRTDVQAKVGAICEAIERYVGVFRDDEPRIRARFDDLEGAVHPGELLGFSDRQYADRHEWNHANLSSYHIVPERFETDREVDWTAAWSLRDGAERLVPTGFCYFGHPDIAEHFFCASDANGNAAGNTLEEAILQGLLEVVERDAAAIWWYNRLKLPAVDLKALGEPYVDTLYEHYEGLGRTLWVLDLTTDLGIPVFAAVSRRHHGPTEDILIGFGAHVDPRMAVLRSLTELNQFLPAVCETNTDGSTNYWLDDPDAIEWWTNSTVESETYVVADPNLAPVDVSRYSGLSSDDLAVDVRTCVDLLATAGHDVIVLDQTRPDIELSVAKVMIPGLRHFWRRLGPGRLYTAPVAMGRASQPPGEASMNPRSVFF